MFIAIRVCLILIEVKNGWKEDFTKPEDQS